ncbi:hypothetical protein [Sphingopyxis sp. JAI128]|uniref:hypothetical protein n=1 Tax=Sphingopyxis sp. JAI128 TaxID=2723066 RepID=UPI00160DD6B0|nr:hypothetical protein [Sphingopyxis sp. JAI128]MBB6427517.1 hypothetical protein [Sphingopyxis sp. JAI128]
MKCLSVGESVSIEDGVAQIAFDLSGSPAAYLIISRPCDPSAADEFFGHDHYLEIKDQRYGSYGPISALEISGASGFRIRFKHDVPDLKDELFIITSAPMSDAIIDQLRALERSE